MKIISFSTGVSIKIFKFVKAFLTLTMLEQN